MNRARVVSTLPPLSSIGLLTDLYELTMAQSYFHEKGNDEASFEMFVREMPPRRGYLVFAGLADAVSFLSGVRFGRPEIRYLASLGRFEPAFLRYLAGFRFSGDMWAMPEGTIFFPGEPIMRVTAPRIEAQIVETFLLNAVNFSVLAATKASRITASARGRSVVDFSPRRAHGADASLKVARSSYIAGFNGTSNLLAGKQFGIPVVGTVAHSFVMSHHTEKAAFEALARTSPEGAVFLLDTYDVMNALEEAMRVARRFAPSGFRLLGVRLDSGDIASQARRVRARLDAAGFRNAKIFASGDLDEYSIARLLARRAPVDSFGVGTALGTSQDSPALGINYKLVSDGTGAGFRLRMKLAQGKKTWPGVKQVWRIRGKRGEYSRDVISVAGERAPARGAEPLLRPVMRRGRAVADLPALERARIRCLSQLSHLPSRFRSLSVPARYPVAVSAGLKALAESTARGIRKAMG
jgi:nicotinate phosphoribosyltransferase